MAAGEAGRTAPEMAVILAAGSGSRLFPQTSLPKPLTQVIGLTLAERVICALGQGARIRRFLIVLGHEAETVRRHFAEVGRRRGVAVEFVEARDWRRGNGASALSSEGRTGEAPFYLVMTDHLFPPEIPAALAQEPPAPEGISLAVDRDKEGIFDLEDVTRVRTDDGRIKAIEKNLADWDAADTGLLLCTPGLFEGLRRAAAKGGHALSDGLRELAREGRAGAVDVTGRMWLDVDTPEGLREAERRLLREGGRKLSDGPVSRHINRPASRWLTRRLTTTSLTPNQISLFSWALSCLAAVLFAAGGYPALAAGGVIAQLASVVDGCDGELARLKYLQSDFGAWLDSVLDRYADTFLLFGLTWHEFAAAGARAPLLIGFAAIAGSYLNSYTADKYDSLMTRKLLKAPRFRLGRDVRVFFLFLGAVLNLPLATLAGIALVMNAEVFQRILLARRESRGDA